MGITSRVAGVLLLGGLLLGSLRPVSADDRRTTFSGCVTERTDASITLKTSGKETVVIDTTWLKPTMRDTLTSECLTVSALTIDGKYVAESVDEGIDNEASSDKDKDDHDDDGDKNSGGND